MGKIKPKIKKLRYECRKCDERFASWQARDCHMEEVHRPPRKTTAQIKRYNDFHNLLGGRKIKLGDRLVFTKIGVVTKVITTERSEDAEIYVAVISDTWQHTD